MDYLYRAGACRIKREEMIIECTIRDITYKSINQASIDTGESVSMIRHRMQSANFPEYVSKHFEKNPIRKRNRSDWIYQYDGFETKNMAEMARRLGIDYQHCAYLFRSKSNPQYVRVKNPE